MTSSTRLRVLLSVLLAVLACVAYTRLRHAVFVQWDDGEFVAENERIQRLTPETIVDIFRVNPKLGPQSSGQYVPLTLLSFALEHRFFGLDPFVYHLDNVLLNACNTLFVFWLVLLFRKGNPAAFARPPDESADAQARSATFTAFVAALFFAVHPLHVESVAWVSERKDVLSVFFYLLAMLLYEAGCRRQRRLWHLLAFLSGVCALLSKPMAVTLPVALVLQDYLMGRAITAKRLMDKAPLVVAAGVLALVTAYTQRTSGALQPHRVADWRYNLLMVPRGILFYLEKAFFPVNLSALYPAPNMIGYLDPDTVLAVAASVLGLAVAAVTWRRLRVVAFCIVFFGVALLPVSQLVPSGVAVAAADRFFYLPSVGVFLLLAWLLDLLRTGRHGRTLAYLLAGGLALPWLALTVERTGTWLDSYALWADTARKTPNSDTVLNNFGLVLAQRGRVREAEMMYHRSLAVGSNSYALVNLGMLRLRLGDTNAARAYLAEAERLDPAKFEMRYARAAFEFNVTNYAAAREYLLPLTLERPLADNLQVRLGAVYVMLAQTNKAIAAMRKALEGGKQGPKLYIEAGQLYEQNGEYYLADEVYRQGLAKFAGQPQLLYRRGVVLSRLGRHSDAISQFTAHLAVQSNNWDAWSNLALACKAADDIERAVEASVRAAAGAPRSPEILYNHACILVAANRFDDAFDALTNAFAFMPGLRDPALADNDLAPLRERLKAPR